MGVARGGPEDSRTTQSENLKSFKQAYTIGQWAYNTQILALSKIY